MEKTSSLTSDIFTVGVTGTNGKTTTTTMIAALLAERSRPVASITTLGSFLDGVSIDVPPGFDGLLATMRAGHEKGGRVAAIEYTSEALARGVAQHWPVDVAVFTNLSHDHLDAHQSLEHYLASKAQLFVNLKERGAAILNGCDENAALIDEVIPNDRRRIAYGLSSRGEPWRKLDLSATDVSFAWSGTDLTVAASDVVSKACKLHIRAIGQIYAENALAALGAALASEILLEAALAGLASVAPSPGRFERVAETPNVVIDYAHSPDALARTLATARALGRGKVIVVLGAGGNRDRAKRPMLGAAASSADRVVLTSDNPRDEDPAAIAEEIREGIAAQVDVVLELDRAHAIEIAIRDAAENDLVVIAGKGHERVQIRNGVARPFSDRDVAIATVQAKKRGRLTHNP
jgi:UDP-N-acetylmuramoyl-L-alanyl-D-glutamate--2,6-diaminopimelate ligase